MIRIGGSKVFESSFLTPSVLHFTWKVFVFLRTANMSQILLWFTGAPVTKLLQIQRIQYWISWKPYNIIAWFEGNFMTLCCNLALFCVMPSDQHIHFSQLLMLSSIPAFFYRLENNIIRCVRYWWGHNLFTDPMFYLPTPVAEKDLFENQTAGGEHAHRRWTGFQTNPSLPQGGRTLGL